MLTNLRIYSLSNSVFRGIQVVYVVVARAYHNAEQPASIAPVRQACRAVPLAGNQF